jgi:hypothetical protein
MQGTRKAAAKAGRNFRDFGAFCLVVKEDIVLPGIGYSVGLHAISLLFCWCNALLGGRFAYVSRECWYLPGRLTALGVRNRKNKNLSKSFSLKVHILVGVRPRRL